MPKKKRRGNQLTVQEADQVLEVLANQQLSTMQIQQLARGYASQCIKIIVDLMHNSKNDSVRLGAARTLLSKVAPDLKAVEITDTNQLKGLVIVKADTSTDLQEAEIVQDPAIESHNKE